ncbi:MAG: lipoprotein [Treponemataceae bacterium]|nr:MAG: lipoprotein [Treponemataceae bacterium]
MTAYDDYPSDNHKPIAGRLATLVLFLALFWGCEYFNRPLKPFIEKHTAEVSVESVWFVLSGITVLPDDFQNGKYVIDPQPDTEILVCIGLDNPVNLALDFSLSWTASDSGMAAAIGRTDSRRVEVLVTGAQRGRQIELRLNAKAETNRTFRLTVPVALNTPLTVSVSPPTGSTPPVACWVMLTPAYHPGIVRAVVSYRYWDGTALVPVREEYGWDESLNDGAGGLTAVSAGRNFSNDGGNCAIDFPASISIPLSATAMYYCFFRVEAYDRFGLSASAETKGFSTVNTSGSARIGSATYPTLSAAIDAAAQGSSENPTGIELIADIQFPETDDNYDIAGKHVKIIPQGATRTIRRTETGSGEFFAVNLGASLTLEGNGSSLLILDGGAVWTGGTANPPSPAYGATNTGITASGLLVAVNGGSLAIKNGATLRNNHGEGQSAPAVCINGGTNTMTGGSIEYNKNSAIGNDGGDGGGMDIWTGTFTMSGGVIKHNWARAGGGVHISKNFGFPVFTMNGNAVVEHNKAEGYGGGGIKTDIDITIAGNAVVRYNTARHTGAPTPGEEGNGEGGGVYVFENALSMEGNARITGNMASRNGSGVCARDSLNNPVVKMSNSAVIAGNNDVYLKNNDTIAIAASLTSGAFPVATITPQTYSTATQVLADGYLLEGYYDRFAVTPNGGQRWSVASNGLLVVSP